MHWSFLVSEPDPRKIRKMVWEIGWGRSVPCTRNACMQARFRLAHDCMPSMFIGNTNRNYPLVFLVQKTKNKWDLLAREVVGAQISSYWTHEWPEVPEIKWVQANNYKFHTFYSVHFHPSLSPRPSFRFSEGLVLRLGHLLDQLHLSTSSVLVN